MKKIINCGVLFVFILSCLIFSVSTHAGVITFFEIRDDANGGVCSGEGHDWDPDTKTCKLTSDINIRVTIADNNLTLDCDSNSILGGGASQTGITINKKRNIVIKNCNIDEWANGIGIFNGSSNILVFNNYLTDIASDGITLGNTSNSRIIDNEVANSGFITTGYSLEDSSRSNEFINNSSTGALLGFIVSNSNNNRFIANSTSTFLVQMGSSRNELIYNISTNSSSHGFSLSDSNNNYLRSNISTGHTGHGFRIDASDANTFIDNISDNNDLNGFIELNSPSRNEYVNNDCNDNTNDNSDPDGLCNEIDPTP